MIRLRNCFTLLFLFCVSVASGDEPAASADDAQVTAPVAVEDVVSDSSIQQRLADIFDARPRYEELSVSVSSGIVTLQGSVDSTKASDWAQDLAERTDGVILVENRVEVLQQFDLGGNLEIIQSSLGRLWADMMAHLPLLVAGAVVLVVTASIAKLVGWVVMKLLASRTRIRHSLKDLVFQLATIGTWVIGLLVAAVIIFPGMTAARAITFLGLGSVAIGFAFKDIFENFFAGILILWRYPFDRGDFISSGDLTGKVEEITIRNTLIRRLDGELAIVPNATLFKNTVDVLTNRVARRVRMTVGVAYREDVDGAREVIHEAVRNCASVDHRRDTEVFACEFAESSINFEVAWWTGATPTDVRRSRDEVVAAVKDALDQAGIEIPFPYRTLTFNDPIAIKTSDALVAQGM